MLLGLLLGRVEIFLLLPGTTYRSRFVALMELGLPVCLWFVKTSLHAMEALTWKVRPVIWIGQQPFQPVLDWLWFPARYATVRDT